MGDTTLKDLFSHHNVDPSGRELTVELGKYFQAMAELIIKSCPEGKWRNQALARLKESSMWSVFSIAESYPVMDPQ